MSPIYLLKTINCQLENRTDIEVAFKKKTFVIHGITVEGVFPVFEGIEVKLDEYYLSDEFWKENNNNDAKCYRDQMKAASISLFQFLQTNPSVAETFNQDQLNALARSSDTIPSYTWHHKEDWLVMQLVKTEMHKIYKHTGGSYTWNKKHFE